MNRIRFSFTVGIFCLASLWPSLCLADGFIVVGNPAAASPGHFDFAPLSVTYHRVNVVVNGLAAVTTVDEEFYNASDSRLEGTYIFPLPVGAHIDKFSMDIGGTMTQAELLPADKARAYYEDIVRRMKDPALLEYADRGAFRLRVYPLEPRSGKRVRITYSELLKSDAGLVSYTYPLNTEKFSATAVKEVSVTVTVDGAEPLKSIYSPSHPVDIRRTSPTAAVAAWKANDAWPDSDFTLLWSRGPSALGIQLLTSRAAGEDGYFMLLASPGIETSKSTVQSKDICFVLDTSGSMAGAKLEQAKKALQFCLANLGAGDRFEIVRFSTDTEQLFGSLVPADKDHVAKALDFVDGLTPMGGTAIGDALATAFALPGIPAAATGRPYLVIFLTDGIPTVGENREDSLVGLVANANTAARVFTFGLGNDVNTHLLDRISSATRAASQYVLPREDIEVKVSGFFAKIRDPVLSNLSVSFSNPSIRVTQLLPSALPDLFSGDMLVVFGKYTGSGSATVTLQGTFNGERREFSLPVSFPVSTIPDSFIPRMWATRRVGWLLDEMRLHGESAELRDEVIGLARAYAIVTPYTAYLVLEDEASRNVPVQLRSFQEMEKDKGAVERVQDIFDSVREEAASESKRSGAQAVQNSLSVQSLAGSTNVQQAAQGTGLAKADAPAAAAGYRASQAQNYAQGARVVRSRAFYLNGTVWTDSTAQSQKGLARTSVEFASEEYFQLIEKYPSAATWLSLGNNVDLVVDGTLYSIREGRR